MRFLHLLHPTASQGRHAAHVDLVAWRAAALRPREADASIHADELGHAEATSPAHPLAPTALHAAAAPDTAARAGSVPAPASGRSESPAVGGHTPTAQSQSAAVQRPGGEPLAAQVHRLPVLPPARPDLPSSAATAVLEAADPDSGDPTLEGLQPVRLTLPSAPAWAPSPQPGSNRSDVAARGRGLADMARETEPATVVHVTIERIDVRLPPAAPLAPHPARETRDSAAARSTPLADYLRGRSPSGGPR